MNWNCVTIDDHLTRYQTSMAETSAPIQFALISHSDSGRAALSRTLAGLDAGKRAENTLQLWEPSGFDDTARLQKRLAVSGNPVGWFLREVVDRYRERPLWQSQQAMRAARDATDLSLYCSIAVRCRPPQRRRMRSNRAGANICSRIRLCVRL